MNRFLITGGIVLCLSILSCKKESDPQQSPAADTTFEVQGIAPVFFQQSPFKPPPIVSQSWRVLYKGGPPQKVELRFTGLPAGIQDSLTTRGGYPDFTTDLQLLSKGIPAGKYEVEVLATGVRSAVTQHYSMPIEVKGASNCTDYFLGLKVKANYFCLSGSPRDSLIYFTRPNGNSDTLLMHNYLGGGKVLKVMFVCYPYNPYYANLVSPSQSFGDTTYKLNGRVVFDTTLQDLPASIDCTLGITVANSPTYTVCSLNLKIQP